MKICNLSATEILAQNQAILYCLVGMLIAIVHSSTDIMLCYLKLLKQR